MFLGGILIFEQKNSFASPKKKKPSQTLDIQGPPKLRFGMTGPIPNIPNKTLLRFGLLDVEAWHVPGDSSRDLFYPPNVGGHLYNLSKRSRKLTIPKKVTAWTAFWDGENVTFSKVKWPPTRGKKGHGLNRLSPGRCFFLSPPGAVFWSIGPVPPPSPSIRWPKSWSTRDIPPCRLKMIRYVRHFGMCWGRWFFWAFGVLMFHKRKGDTYRTNPKSKFLGWMD